MEEVLKIIFFIFQNLLGLIASILGITYLKLQIIEKEIDIENKLNSKNNR